MTTTDWPADLSSTVAYAVQETPAAHEHPSGETPGRHRATPESGMETLHSMEETPLETPEETPAGRDGVELAALFVVVSVLIAASGWSAIALHGLAQAAGITSWLAWGAPIIVDGPLFQAAIALVVLKRRAKAGVPVEAGHRSFFWWMLAMSELVSLIGNGAHAWMSPDRSIDGLAAAAVAGVAPIAAMAVMHGLMILIEVLTRTPDSMPVTMPQTIEITNRTPVLAVSPGDSEVSPAVSTPLTGDTQGDTQVSPAVSTTGEGDTQGDSEVSPGDTTDPVERDARILALRAEGKSYREIAAEVGVSSGAVGKILQRLAAAAAADSNGPVQGATVLQLVR